jgi:hypothetical protein
VGVGDRLNDGLGAGFGSGMQMVAGGAGCCGLGGVLLCEPKVGNGLGESTKAGGQCGVGEGPVASGVSGG